MLRSGLLDAVYEARYQGSDRGSDDVPATCGKECPGAAQAVLRKSADAEVPPSSAADRAPHLPDLARTPRRQLCLRSAAQRLRRPRQQRAGRARGQLRGGRPTDVAERERGRRRATEPEGDDRCDTSAGGWPGNRGHADAQAAAGPCVAILEAHDVRGEPEQQRLDNVCGDRGPGGRRLSDPRRCGRKPADLGSRHLAVGARRRCPRAHRLGPASPDLSVRSSS
jgi:hypothetical protein